MSSYGAELPQASVQSAAALTNSELVAAVTDAQVKVAAVFVMSDTAGTVTFNSGTGSGTTLRWQVYPGANGGAVVPSPGEGQFWFQGIAGESLTVTTDITGEQFISVLYVVE